MTHRPAPLTPEQRESIAKLLAKGVDIPHIARLTLASEAQVRRVAKEQEQADA